MKKWVGSTETGTMTDPEVHSIEIEAEKKGPEDWIVKLTIHKEIGVNSAFGDKYIENDEPYMSESTYKFVGGTLSEVMEMATDALDFRNIVKKEE